MFGLAGCVDAAKSVSHREVHQSLGVGLLPSGAVDNSRDANFVVGNTEWVHGSALTSTH
jgi:hypothetical protein